MATIRKFEDLKVWQQARTFCKMVNEYILERSTIRSYSFKDQIDRFSGSVMDNIAEGFGRGGTKEFVNFLSIARGSCNAAKSQVYRAIDRKYIDQDEAQKLLRLTERILGMISSFMSYLHHTNSRERNLWFLNLKLSIVLQETLSQDVYSGSSRDAKSWTRALI